MTDTAAILVLTAINILLFVGCLIFYKFCRRTLGRVHEGEKRILDTLGRRRAND